MAPQDAPVPPGAAQGGSGVEFDGSGDESLVVDLGSTEAAAARPLIPKGTYDAVIDKCDFGYSNSSGNPMWTLQLLIDGGDHSGRKLYSYITWTKDAMPRAKRTLQRIAPELASTRFDVTSPEVTESLVGRRVRIQLTHRFYAAERRWTENVKDLLPPLAAAGPGGAPMPPS